MKKLLSLFPTMLSNRKAESFRLPTLNHAIPLRWQSRVGAAFALLALLCLVPAAAAEAMKLLSPDIGWLTDQGHLYWTTDGGDHWTDITPVPPEVPQPNLGGVLFRDVHEGWAMIAYSEEVGPARNPHAPPETKTLYGIAHTVDSGASWSFTPVTYPELPQWLQDGFAGPASFYFLDALHGWIDVGFEGLLRPGKLLATEDGGRTWKWVNSPGVAGPITFLSLQDGWLVSNLGGEKLYVTHDGCNTWHEVSLSPPPQVGAATFPTFHAPPVFQDEHRGFLVVNYLGFPGTPSKLVVYSTADSGKTWQPIKVLLEAQEAWGERSFPFAIADSAIIVSTGSSPTKVKLAAVPLDGGSSDVSVSSRWVIALTFADKRKGWVSRAGSGLLGTLDEGSTWKHIAPSQTPAFPSKTIPALKGPPMEVTHEPPSGP